MRPTPHRTKPCSGQRRSRSPTCGEIRQSRAFSTSTLETSRRARGRTLVLMLAVLHAGHARKCTPTVSQRPWQQRGERLLFMEVTFGKAEKRWPAERKGPCDRSTWLDLVPAVPNPAQPNSPNNWPDPGQDSSKLARHRLGCGSFDQLRHDTVKSEPVSAK